MLGNYFKIALRNLLKYKSFSLINIIGLAIGLAACLTIMVIVEDELSFDKHHEKAENIYRIAVKGRMGEIIFNMAVSAHPTAAAAKNDFPEVLESVRIDNSGDMLIRYNDLVYNENSFLWADSTIFNVFTIPLLQGDKDKALNRPHTIVLSEKAARKFFGKKNPVGENLEFENGQLYEVTGVYEDFPINSHFQADFIASIISWDNINSDFWLSHNLYTYIVVQEGTNIKEFEEKLNNHFLKKYIGPTLTNLMNTNLEELAASGNGLFYSLQPLLDIHLHSHLEWEIGGNGNILYIYVFSAIAVFVLIIAVINFVNLTTARSGMRAKEVGMRKVLGSSRTQLIYQFLTESVIVSFIAMAFALLILELSVPLVTTIINKAVTVSYFDAWYKLPVLVSLALLIGLAAGAYPALILSGFKPIKILRTAFTKGSGRHSLRNTLVVVQFAASIVLVIGTIIIYNQLNYMQNKNLGFNKDHVIVIKREWSLEDRRDAFKNEIYKNPNIVKASASNGIMGGDLSNSAFRMSYDSPDIINIISRLQTDYDFLDTYQFELTKGRFFSREFKSDSSAVVLTEGAVKQLGIADDPLGKQIVAGGRTPDEDIYFTIIGVVKDFHYQTFEQPIRPLLFVLGTGQMGNMSIRVTPHNITQTISKINKSWSKFTNGKPFEYFFFDENFDRLFSQEIAISQLTSLFSLLAIFIACLGLYGLALFTTQQKTKEIGIRKAMGASVGNIVLMLSKEFTKWVIFANLIAWPLAYYLMNEWLTNFAFRIEINYLYFAAAGIIALLIAWLTVSYLSYRAASMNPVKSLRYE